MDVIDIVASARGAKCRIGLAQLCLLLAALFGLAACGEPGATVITDQGPTGTMEVNLVGQGNQGTLFRLRDAIVTVQGPDRTIFFNSEDDPDETSFSAVVPGGSYSSFLQEGWRLERVDSGKSVVAAALISENPAFFEVVPGEITRVALRFQAGQEVVVTDPGLLEIVIEVEEEPAQSTLCAADSECPSSQVCCVTGFLGSCQSLEPGQSCPLPDLTVSAEVAEASLIVNQEFFPPSSCAIEEGCVAGTGMRRLLRFSTMTPNIGESDLILGDPTGTPGFEFAPCHSHYHFNGYARYELVDETGDIVAVGHKQAFCLLDSQPVLPGAPATPRYHCDFQGLTRGWADIYGAGLDCQWVDITDVAEGDYLLRISINPDQVIEESDYGNNTVEVPVTLGPSLPPEEVDPLASCSQLAEAGVFRECGWAFAAGAEGVECEPGELLSIGCGCTSGPCGGDPILRVCDGTEACTGQTALSLADDTCETRCPQSEFVCPASGVYSVLTSSFLPDQPFSCNVR
jgi:hypothetical protein